MWLLKTTDIPNPTLSRAAHFHQSGYDFCSWLPSAEWMTLPPSSPITFAQISFPFFTISRVRWFVLIVDLSNFNRWCCFFFSAKQVKLSSCSLKKNTWWLLIDLSELPTSQNHHFVLWSHYWIKSSLLECKHGSIPTVQLMTKTPWMYWTKMIPASEWSEIVQKFTRLPRNVIQFETYRLFTSGIFHLIFLQQDWTQGAKTGKWNHVHELPWLYNFAMCAL